MVAVTIVAVPVINRPATVIGVRTRPIIVARTVVIVAIRARCRDRARRDRTRGKAERQARSDAGAGAATATRPTAATAVRTANVFFMLTSITRRGDKRLGTPIVAFCRSSGTGTSRWDVSRKALLHRNRSDGPALRRQVRGLRHPGEARHKTPSTPRALAGFSVSGDVAAHPAGCQ